MLEAATDAAVLDTPAETAAAPKLVDPDTLGGRANLNQTPVGTSGRWSLEKCLALTQEEGIAIWRTLPAPTLEEMNGHYFGMGPEGKNPDFQKGYAKFMYDETSPRGFWLGKAFRPLNATQGEGYNRWRRPGGKVERNLRMATRVADSIIDGKPCYVLDYSAFHASTLYDEIRKMEDGLYFCTASTAKKGGGRTDLSFFILTGPTDEWVGAPYTEAEVASKN